MHLDLGVHLLVSALGIMVKRVVSKRTVLAFAHAKTPAVDRPKMSFKEVKMRTILQGLRALKAPAVPGQHWNPPRFLHILLLGNGYPTPSMCFCVPDAKFKSLNIHRGSYTQTAQTGQVTPRSLDNKFQHLGKYHAWWRDLIGSEFRGSFPTANIRGYWIAGHQHFCNPFVEVGAWPWAGSSRAVCRAMLSDTRGIPGLRNLMKRVSYENWTPNFVWSLDPKLVR